MIKNNKIISIAIIGGGPAGMMAAATLGKHFSVKLFEKEKRLGQKFLVAGKGGFNLTNNLNPQELKNKYLPSGVLNESINSFNVSDFRDWLSSLGIPTFVGTSNRVFPEEGIKPVEVLNKIKNELESNNVEIFYNHKFVELKNNSAVILENDNKTKSIIADYFIFALGGASWQITGSDGKWIKPFNSAGINTLPFQSSNCGVNIDWQEEFIKNHSGKPLKNINISCGGFSHKGETTITDYGLEGNAVYPIIPDVRTMLDKSGKAFVDIDLKPNNTIEQLLQKLMNKNCDSKIYSKELNLNSTQLALLKTYSTKKEFLDRNLFVEKIKKLEIPITSLRPIDEAISTVGGVNLSEVDKNFALKKFTNIYTVGEMLDWDAPTGGFLLQGCFSTAFHAAQSIIKKHFS